MKRYRTRVRQLVKIRMPLAVLTATFASPPGVRGTDVFFNERVITKAANDATSVYAIDLNGDGHTDVLSASWNDDKIAWYESNGGFPPVFTEHVISTGADAARFVFAKDVDGDGDIDVLSASIFDDKIAWYESSGGSQPTFTEHVISTTANFATSVFAIDVDGDGDTDILSSSQIDGKIAWYDSDGNLPPTFTERIISTTAIGADSVFAIDMNGDGNIDVLSASIGDDKVAWYESDGGSPPSFVERVISATADGARSVHAIDLDSDGDIDVISALSAGNKIMWYESSGGLSPSFTGRTVSLVAEGASSVFAIDVDGDGNIDILSVANEENKIAWHESDGGLPPSFTEHVISATTLGPISVFATDVDGDGDTDVLSASASNADDKIAWYENTTCGDGLVEGGEECDDGDLVDGDGCSATCTVELQSICTGEPSECVTGVPTVSTWGLIVMTLLTLTTGTLVLLRKRISQT